MEKGIRVLNSNRLKWIAIVLMLIDHVGAALNALARYAAAGSGWTQHFTDDFYFMRLIGRMSFPIFAFLIAEGCANTSNINKYLRRLLIFALLSQLPYQLFLSRIYGYDSMFDVAQLNVLFSLAAGVICVICYRKFRESGSWLWVLYILVIYCVVPVLRMEYDLCAITIILLCYIFRPKKPGEAENIVTGSHTAQALCCMVVSFAYYALTGGGVVQGLMAALSGVFLLMYNGEPGSRRGKWFFYVFYPAHMVIISGALMLLMA